MIWRKLCSQKKGSVTIEFVLIIPLFVMMAMVIWQFAIAGLAVINTQSALRDAIRVATVTHDINAARKEAYKSFGYASDYRLKNVEIQIGHDNVIAKATTEIDILFMKSNSFHYKRTAQAPLVD